MIFSFPAIDNVGGKPRIYTLPSVYTSKQIYKNNKQYKIHRTNFATISLCVPSILHKSNLNFDSANDLFALTQNVRNVSTQ